MALVRRFLCFVAFSLSLPLFAASGSGDVKSSLSPIQKGSHWSLPLAFERNEGQMPAYVGFLGRTQHYTVAVGRDELRFALPGGGSGSSVTLSFEGGKAEAAQGITEAPFRTNSYLGGDVSKYRSGIRNYSRIGLSHLYPGVDAEFYASGEEMEHDFDIAPGADASVISMRLRSAKAATLTAQGEVIVPAAEGELLLKKPVAYQVTPEGKRVEVAAAFMLDAAVSGGQRLRFHLGAYDHSRKLVIDPVILYASYLAGAAGSTANAIASEATNGIYVAGTTSSASFDPTDNTVTAVTPVKICGTDPCTNTVNAFIANFTNSGSSTPTLHWVTYLGGSEGATPAITVTSLVAKGAALYMGGSTNDTALAASSSSTAPNATGGYVGFVSSLSSVSGALNDTALVYIDAAANNNSVQALALDAAGDVYAAGAIGTQTADPSPAAFSIVPTADAFSVAPTITTSPIGSTSLPGNAYVLRMHPDANGVISAATTHVANPVFFTYIQNNAEINGIAVDASESVYLAGQTQGNFSLLPNAVGTNTGTASTFDAFELSFQDISVASAPVVATVTQFAWIDGGADDTVTAIAVDEHGSSYLFGNTTSDGLGTAEAIQSTRPDSTGSGFIAKIPAPPAFTLTDGPAVIAAGGVAPTAVTYLGGSGAKDSITAGIYANSSLYVTGQTDAPANTASPAIAFSGISSTSGVSAAPFNVKAMPFGMDATAGGTARGYLANLDSALATVNYVANLGGAGGTDSANGVALDSAQNAYVAATLGYNSSSSSVAPPYTSYSAYEVVSPATASNTSAYVAEITFAAVSSQFNLQTATDSSTTPIGYDSVDSTSMAVTYKWTLDSASPAANTVLQIPNVTGLSYTSVTITDTNTGATNLASCTTVPSLGISCLIPSIPQKVAGISDTLEIALNASTTSALSGSSVTVTANAFSGASDYASNPQTNTVSKPAKLTIGPASFTAMTVGSGTNADTAATKVVYALTVQNAADGGDTGKASFVVTGLPTGFTATAVTVNVSGASNCDTTVAATGCTSFDLAPGAILTYTVTGFYNDSVVPQGGTSITAGSISATANGFLDATSATIATNTTVTRSAHLKIAGSLSSGAGTINLDAAETYTLTVTNSGPSTSSGLDTFNLTLPAGFVADANAQLTCATMTSPYTGCTFSALSGSGSGSVFTLTLTGKFPDANTSNQTIGKTAVSQSFIATVTLKDATDSAPAPGDETSTVSASVQRSAPLTLSLGTPTVPGSVCKGAGPNCVYMKNTPDTQDKVSYSLVINNGGPNTALNAVATIALPAVSGAHVTSVGTPMPTGSAPPFGALPTCVYTSGTNQITCSGNIKGSTAVTIPVSISFDDSSVPANVAFINTQAGSIHADEDAVGAPTSDTTIPVVEVDRAAHLVTAKQVKLTGTIPVSPINLEESTTSTTPGVNDTFTVTVQVGNTQLNDAPAVVVTEMLPPYFRMTQPPTGANCTVGTSPAVAVTANYTTQGTAVPMACSVGTVNAGDATASSSGTAGLVGTTPQSFSYTGKFVDGGSAPDITGTLPNKLKDRTVSLGAASSATTLAADPITPSDATSSAPSIEVQRLAHLVLRKTRNSSVAATPASFVDTTDPNLDEKTSATAFGVNDEVEYDIAIGNGGVNMAPGVQFTETLPPYFTVMKAYLVSGASMTPDFGANMVPGGQLPAGSIACYAGTTLGTNPITLPFATGAASQPITCSYGTTANPLALSPGASRTGMPDNATSVEFVYQGKYQDNAPSTDNIGPGVSTYAVTSMVGEASATTPLAVDNGPVGDGKSTIVPPYSIQRAAHLRIVGTPAQLKSDETPLTPGGVGGTSIIGEAEPSAGGATPVYNCLRYKVLVQNDGPNIARQPQLTVTPPTGLNLTGVASNTTTTAGTDAPLPSTCSYGATTAPTVNGAAIAPVSQRAGNTLVMDLDGYFGLNTLTAVNSQTGFPLSYTALSDRGVMDSSKAMAFTPITGSSVTVVNTPSGNNFLVAPFSATGTRPAQVAFGTVSVPGVTTTAVSGIGPALPTGGSPDPRDNKKVISLYHPGSVAPNFYTLATSAVVPGGNNPTGICVVNGATSGPLSDGFAKPERVLLWALAGLPDGTTLHTVPNVTSPYAGDITSSVIPSNGSSYVAPGGSALPYTTYANLPGTQSQPAQVCGQVNGFASAATPLTVAVLEPVNFAPYIAANGDQASQTPGKGVSEVSFLFPNGIHDYNDNDPCYVSSSTSGTPSRGTCDDNLLLTTWVFGGERLIPSLDHVVGPLSPTDAQTFVNAPRPYEVQGGASLFFQVADQLAAPVYNAKQDCDPGNAPGSYTPSTVNACPINTGLLSGNPPQETVFGSANIAILTPSVSGGSSGLIILPPAADATVATTAIASGYTAATATITAGQTVGFQWKLGDVIPAAGGAYNLTCFMVDAATQNTVMPFPAGLSCQIPPTITYPANPTVENSPANPAIYIVSSGSISARNQAPVWKGSLGEVVAALLLPLMVFYRKKPTRKLGLLVLLLLLGGAAGLSGCGSGIGVNNTPPVAPDTYYFRANATPVSGGATLTTAPFQVKIVTGE